MGAITSENTALAMVKLVAAQALPALVGNLVMGNIINRNYESVLASAGESVNVPIPPVMSRNNIAETGSVQTQSPTPGNATINLNQHAESSFQIPDVIKVLSHPGLLAMYMQPAIIALAEGLETDLLALYPQISASAGSSVAAISEDAVDDAETTLFTAKVPSSMQKFLVLHPTPYGTLRQIARLTEADKVGSGLSILTGRVEQLKDFFVLRSSFVTLSSSVYYNLAFARDAFALAIRRLPIPEPGTGAIGEFVEMGNFGMRVLTSYNATTLAQQYTVDMLYGCGVLRPSFGCQVVCSA